MVRHLLFDRRYSVSAATLCACCGGARLRGARLPTVVRCSHFVGFRGEEYWSAVKVWGQPDFYHCGYDNRMGKVMAVGDLVVFANGCEAKGPQFYSYPDIIEVENG